MTTPPEPMGITSPTLHMTVLLSLAVFVATLAISFTFRVEVVARGRGASFPLAASRSSGQNSLAGSRRSMSGTACR